jgi:hypothetical protein
LLSRSLFSVFCLLPFIPCLFSCSSFLCHFSPGSASALTQLTNPSQQISRILTTSSYLAQQFHTKQVRSLSSLSLPFLPFFSSVRCSAPTGCHSSTSLHQEIFPLFASVDFLVVVLLLDRSLPPYRV